MNHAMRTSMRKGAGLAVPLKPLHGPRKARCFEGWAYPSVGTGEQITQFTVELSAANIAARKHYDDPANRLHVNDITGGENGVKLTEIIGKPVMIEHGNNKKYGQSIFGVVDTAILEPDNRIHVTGRVFGANEDGSENELAMDAIGEMDSGILGSLSLRWRTLLGDNNTVIHKDVLELSLCHKPHYDGCVITTTCSQPSSVAAKYSNTEKHVKITEVERILSLTMSASTQDNTPQNTAAANAGQEAALGQQPTALSPPVSADSNKDTADMIAKLTQKLQAENEARRAAEKKAQEYEQWKQQKEAEEKQRLDALKEEALKPLPHILQQLQRYGEVDKIHQDTAEMLAHVMAEPVVNPNQQLGAIVTACSAKLEKQEKLIEKLTAQIKRTGNASSVAELHMAASAAEDLLNLVDEPRNTRDTSQIVDPMLQQKQERYSSYFQAGSLPQAFYGDGWSMPNQHQSTGPSLAQRIEAQRFGMTSAQPRAIEMQASSAETAAPEQYRQQMPIPEKLQRQQQTTSTFQQQQSFSQDFVSRVASMNPQRARDLVQVSSVQQLGFDEDFPTQRGDVFG